MLSRSLFEFLVDKFKKAIAFSIITTLHVTQINMNLIDILSELVGIQADLL